MTVEVRAATAAEGEQILALQVDRNGVECDGPIQYLLAHHDVGPSRFTVAVDGSRVVSSLCLIPHTLRVGDVLLSTGEIEYVATAADYGHRGLVRAQVDLAHRWSRQDGHVVQTIGGIPYFYRQFGYEYAISFPRFRLLDPGVTLTMPAGWTVRQAAVEDISAIISLQLKAQEAVTIARLRTDPAWWERWITSGDPPHLTVAVNQGRVRGTGATGPAPSPIGDAACMVAHIAFDDADALSAILAAAAEDPRPLAIHERPLARDLVAGIAHLHPRIYAMYVRVEDPVAVLDLLRPVLTARLQASPWSDLSGQLLLSLYSRAIVFEFDHGQVVAVRAAPGEQNPGAHGGIGVPPDQIATLIFGRYGASGLLQRHDDVWLGRHAGLAEVLFPRVEADISLA